MMGIRKIILPVLALNLALVSTAFGARTNLQIAFDACDDMGGSYVEGNGAISADGKKYCSEVICVKTSANVGTINFDTVVANSRKGLQGEGDAEGDRGYAVLAHDKNVCVPHTSAADVARERGAERRRQEAEDRSRREAELAAREAREQRDTERRAEEDRRSSERDTERDGGRTGGDVSVSGGIDFGPFRDGARISIGGDIYTVGSDDFYRVCMRNNRITDRCARGRVVGFDTDHSIGGDIDWQMRNNGDGKIRSSGGVRFYTYNGRTFECGYDQDPVDCLRSRYGEINARIGDIHNCVNCNSSYRISSSRGSNSSGGGINLSGIAEVIGALAPIGVGYLGYKGMKVNAKAQLGVAQAYAGAQTSGYENCRMMQTHYMDSTYAYLQSSELPDKDLEIPECNGYGNNQYAQGNGNWNNGNGSFGNGWNSSGYGPNFQGRMYGPGAGYNFGMNANSGWGNPNAGLGYNMQGNFNLGQLLGLPSINFNANANANMNNGWGNNYNNNNRGNVCFGGPCQNTGWNGNWNGNNNGNWGNNGNFNANIGWNAGANGTVPWGNNHSQYQWNGNNNGNWNGNWNGNSNGNWGNNNNGSGNWGNNNNGSVNGNQFWAVQNAHNQNQQSYQAGNYYQQAALNNRANQANYNASQGSNGYNPGYSPGNFGFQVNAGYNFGFQ